MIDGLEPYPAMKDSGVKWLGEVPAHWEVQRLGHFGTFSKGNGGSKEDEVSAGIPCIRYGDLYTTHQYFITKSRSFVSRETAKAYTTLEFGDVLFAASGETVEEIGKSAVNLLRSEACCGGDVILFRPKQEVEPQFIGYATGCLPAATQKATMGRGITVIHIYADQLKRLNLALPPLSEQAAIARFLDIANRRIGRYIRAKEKLIALLEEQKRAIIHQAVTGRIDVRTGKPYPAYKPSGVEWLGRVPAHWKIRRLKFLASIPSGQVDPRLKEHQHKVLVAPNHILPGSGKLTDLKTADEQGADSGKYEIRVGDVIYSKIRPNLRKAAISPVNGLCSADMYPIRVREDEIESSFFLLLLLSDQVTKYTVDCSLRVAMPKVNREALGNCLLAYPMLPEQALILEEIFNETARLELLISEGQREIELFREFRTRLIADVVTGKLDVREAATVRPEEPDDPDTLEGDCAGAIGRDYGDPERDRRTEAPMIQEELTS